MSDPPATSISVPVSTHNVAAPGRSQVSTGALPDIVRRPMKSKLYDILAMVSSFGLYLVCRATMCFAEQPNGLTTTSHAQEHNFDSLEGMGQWRAVLEKLDVIWKGACAASFALLPLSLNMLQIGGVINNDIARTSALVSFSFSGTGLIAGCLFISSKHNFQEPEHMEIWVKACQHRERVESINLWTCLMLPMSSVVWSIIFYLVTTIVIAWTNWQTQNQGSAHWGVTFSGTIFTIILFGNMVQLYLVMRLVGKPWCVTLVVPDRRLNV